MLKNLSENKMSAFTAFNALHLAVASPWVQAD